MSKQQFQVVVRKNKSHKHAHHGGSWKIAYADFMTAMMAFFLVMWLVSSSNPGERQRIAEYFKMPIKVALSHGNKASLSSSPIPGGGDNMLRQQGEVLRQDLNKIKRSKDYTSLSRARDRLQSLIKSDPRLSNYQSNLRISLTEDGLLIQIIDSQDRPMFKLGSKELEPYMNDILRALVPVLNDLPNLLSLTGHTDSLPYARGEAGYSNWELSSDRANASRRALMAGGMLPAKFLRVIGSADMMNMDNAAPDNPLNRRISILVLTEQRKESIIREDKLIQEVTQSQGAKSLPESVKMTPNDPAKQPVSAPAIQPDSDLKQPSLAPVATPDSDLKQSRSTQVNVPPENVKQEVNYGHQ